MWCVLWCCCFFNQKTAYEMRISDWSSDVCSSDLQILEQRDAFLTPTLAEWRRRLDRVAEWIAGEDRLEWVRPAGGVVAFPRMVTDPPGGTDAFYRRLLDENGTYVGTGHWFEKLGRAPV